MLDRNFVVGTDDRPFQEGPYVLNRVCVNVATNILFGAVIDRLVSGIFVSDAIVGCPVVGKVSLSIVGGILSNELMQWT